MIVFLIFMGAILGAIGYAFLFTAWFWYILAGTIAMLLGLIGLFGKQLTAAVAAVKIRPAILWKTGHDAELKPMDYEDPLHLDVEYIHTNDGRRAPAISCDNGHSEYLDRAPLDIQRVDKNAGAGERYLTQRIENHFLHSQMNTRDMPSINMLTEHGQLEVLKLVSAMRSFVSGAAFVSGIMSIILVFMIGIGLLLGAPTSGSNHRADGFKEWAFKADTLTPIEMEIYQGHEWVPTKVYMKPGSSRRPFSYCEVLQRNFDTVDGKHLYSRLGFDGPSCTGDGGSGKYYRTADSTAFFGVPGQEY